MAHKLKKSYIPIILIALFGFSMCTEPFDAPIEDFDDILVVDAFITSEVKNQEIFISRTFISGEDINPESGANISITDDLGNNYNFGETEPGTYVSEVVFGAQPNVDYFLSINTSGGRTFEAGPVSIVGDAELESITPVISTNDRGQEGISVLVNSFDPEGEAVFYRYDYEETFQIISRYITFLDFVIISENPPQLGTTLKTREESVCYNTRPSNSIVITTAENLSESRIEDFQVKFIPKTDSSIRDRYSILVNQYVQSQAAQTFYEDLQEFSNIRTVFAQTQPGFIRGNIRAVNEGGERVLGLFEVASKKSERIFFEHRDFFAGEPRPDYGFECELTEYNGGSQALFALVRNNRVKYVDEGFGTFFVAPNPCVDCTIFGTNVRPDFWED